jgi:hypothetical protein
METKHPNITVKPVGIDNTALSFLGKVRRGLVQRGVSKEDAGQLMQEAMTGNYDHLQQTCMRWANCESKRAIGSAKLPDSHLTTTEPDAGFSHVAGSKSNPLITRRLMRVDCAVVARKAATHGDSQRPAFLAWSRCANVRGA